MTLDRLANNVIDTDVLVIGGGVAGCPAAAKAAEHGLSVTLVEKSKVDRSGSAGQGMDHYGGAFPRGMTVDEFVEIWKELGWESAWYFGGKFADPNRLYRLYANGQWGVEELEKLGVNMKWYDGKIRPIKSVRQYPFLRIHWMYCKPEMAAGVKKRGVNVLNRTMITDLLTHNGTVVGATAVDTRTGAFTVIRAKATIIATAACSRIYDPETPVPWKYKFRFHWCPASVSGDGWAMGFRAGAEMANFEQTERGYRYRDDLTLSQGNRNNEGVSGNQFTWDGEPMCGRDRADLERQGKTPIYVTIENIGDDFQKRVEIAYVDERMISLKAAQDRGFNPRHHWYELMDDRPNQLHVPPGLLGDMDFKTTLKGLYVIGDSVAGQHDVANAAVSGFLVGDSISSYIKQAAEPIIDEAQVQSIKETVLAPLSVKDGTPPMELECAIRYACNRYVGTFRAEGKIREGLRRLASLKREFLPKLTANNPHFLTRCLEVRNLFDVAELHMLACLERKESRDFQIRLDYPDKDPKYEGMLLHQKLVNGKITLDWKKQGQMTLAGSHKEER